MTGSDEMRQRWEELHAQPRFRPRYPHERIVAWLFRNFRRNSGAKVLDLGCGAGRHALFLASEGYEAHACDISTTGLRELEAMASARGVSVATRHMSADDLSGYEDASFDAVISFSVLYYLSFDRAQAAVREIRRVLKPGGKLCCVLRTDADSRRDGAEPVGPCTWKLGTLAPGAPSDGESGMEMLFFSHDEVVALFAGFTDLCVDRMTYQHQGFFDDDWVVTAAV